MKTTPFPDAYRDYLRDVVAWHGFVKFLGLPSLQSNPDVPIDELYIPHKISDTYISPDFEDEHWATLDPLTVLAEKKHIIILGDPGSGKSTLINWLAWIVAARFWNRVPPCLAQLLPIPIVLRELSLEKVCSIESLIEAFLQRPVAALLKGTQFDVNTLLANGALLILIDGLDEVSADERARVGKAIQMAIAKYPNLFLLCTSRIVGYSDSPVFGKIDPNPDRAEVALSLGPRFGETYYVAPFDNSQIERFSQNWYREQGAAEGEARLLRDDFMLAIKSEKSTMRLARTPNLLTMMALIFRVRARLPAGRALLYEDIAQAYLESIDTARRLKDEFPWQRKKRWLARIAFEMQIRRTSIGPEMKDTDGPLLVHKNEVLNWVVDAMGEKGSSSEAYAERYIEWIARRSGLLLPRGEDLFAFLHLSFQEYFTAVYIKQQMENPSWNSIDHVSEDELLDERVTVSSLNEWVESFQWQPVFIFLFELFAERDGWPRRLFKMLFAPLELGMSSLSSARSLLFMDVLGNPHSGLPGKLFAEQIVIAEELVIQEQRQAGTMFKYFGQRTILTCALASPIVGRYVLDWLRKSNTSLRLSGLDVRVARSVLESLPEPRALESLALVNSQVFPEIDLSDFQNLRELFLFNAGLTSVDFLRGMTRLNVLDLQGNPLQDLRVLSELRELRELDLDETEVGAIDFVRNMPLLEKLSLSHTRVTDLKPIFDLPHLERFHIFGNVVEKLPRFRPDSRIKSLFAGGGLESVEEIGELSHLEMLLLGPGNLGDISPLANCSSLRELSFIATTIINPSPLRRLSNLVSLDFHRVKLRNIRFLEGMSNIESLSLNWSLVKDLSPLLHLKQLRALRLVGFNGKRLSVISEIASLRELVLSSSMASDVHRLELNERVSVTFI